MCPSADKQCLKPYNDNVFRHIMSYREKQLFLPGNSFRMNLSSHNRCIRKLSGYCVPSFSLYMKTVSLFRLIPAVVLFLFCWPMPGEAQHERAQYPPFLAQSFFSVNVGYLNYPFSSAHMEPGFVAESVTVPHTGVRLMLYGRQLSKYLSMQISYMRPVLWVVYRNVNGMTSRHSVWMNIAGLTLKPQLPLGKKFSLTGEFGLSIITRHGFQMNYQTVVRDANYASILLGSGLKYHLNDRWDLMVHGVWSPENKKARQPYTFFLSPGFQYNMRPLSSEIIQKKMASGYIFPRHQLQIGFSSNAAGYGVNSFFSDGLIPVFWGGDLHIERGIALSYNNNVFHGRKTFSLDLGISIGYWETKQLDTPLLTLSAYPVLRFTLLRTNPADFYFYYSVAGPTFISKAMVDGIDTGKRFTFQDNMGAGIFAGKNREVSAELRIGHYSNGNLFPQNPGVKVPLTFSVGYNF